MLPKPWTEPIVNGKKTFSIRIDFVIIEYKKIQRACRNKSKTICLYFFNFIRTKNIYGKNVYFKDKIIIDIKLIILLLFKKNIHIKYKAIIPHCPMIKVVSKGLDKMKKTKQKISNFLDINFFFNKKSKIK